jgi:hypothetical protein
MRLDDDNSHSFAPLLRRIFILVVVIAAVPVMLWTITTFMRTYVAQPVIASARPLVPATLGSDTVNGPAAPPAAADANPAQPAPTQAPAIVEARATATDARDSDTDSKGNRASDTTASVTTAKVAALATADASSPPTAPVATVSGAAQPTPAASSPWPAVTAAPAPTMGAQPAEPVAQADTAAADALPSTALLTGPIPLPPRRPTVFALAETSGVPLPRARPATAPASTPPPVERSSGYSAGLGPDHY